MFSVVTVKKAVTAATLNNGMSMAKSIRRSSGGLTLRFEKNQELTSKVRGPDMLKLRAIRASAESNSTRVIKQAGINARKYTTGDFGIRNCPLTTKATIIIAAEPYLPAS
jgi:hypothetical protein